MLVQFLCEYYFLKQAFQNTLCISVWAETVILIFVGVLCLDFLTLRNTHKSHIWHIIGSLLLIDKFHLFKAMFFHEAKGSKVCIFKIRFRTMFDQ